ncbi:MAG: hypothetical protein M1392_00605 [Gammaproteobacteria bacterium]|nr:hypothetical protein [Gammaproteobacteria bacterium]
MGLFSGIKSNYKKSEAAVVVQNLLEHYELLDLGPSLMANKLVAAIWEEKPDVFSGKFGQRPHKLTVAAAALANGIHLFEKNDLNRSVLALSLGTILSEIEVNGGLYPLNSLDRQLLEEAQAGFFKVAGELDNMDILGDELSKIIPRIGFSVGGDVNDVAAVALKKLTDMVLKKYVALPHDQLTEAISRDFDARNRCIVTDYMHFVFAELPEFQFNLGSPIREDECHDLSVIGRGKYVGFMLQVANGSNWVCSANDGISYRATSGARKLVELMNKKYGISDFSDLFKDI